VQSFAQSFCPSPLLSRSVDLQWRACPADWSRGVCDACSTERVVKWSAYPDSLSAHTHDCAGSKWNGFSCSVQSCIVLPPNQSIPFHGPSPSTFHCGEARSNILAGLSSACVIQSGTLIFFLLVWSCKTSMGLCCTVVSV
jgi:hypothetical protein